MQLDLEGILTLLSFLIRFLGLLVFGVAAGWFTLTAFRHDEKSWQLQIAVYLGFLGLTAVLARFTTAGALGAYALGAGGATLIWGLGLGQRQGGGRGKGSSKK